MTTYLPSPGIAVTPSPRPAQTVLIAAFGCEGLGCLSRQLGFPVAVVAAVEDVARHAQRLRDTWYASGVARSWSDWPLPIDFDNWLFRHWSAVPFDPRWFGRSGHPLAASVVDGTLAMDLPTGVDMNAYAAAFRAGLAEMRFEAVTRRPSYLVKWHHSRRTGIPASRYALASAGNSTPMEVRDVVRLTPRDLPAIATVALATLGQLAGTSRAAAPAVGGL